MNNKIEHFYLELPKDTDNENEGFEIPNGETWLVKEVILQAGSTPDTVTCLVFGEEILLATYGSVVVNLNRRITGAEGKAVQLKFHNGYNKAQIMGGSYTLRKDEGY